MKQDRIPCEYHISFNDRLARGNDVLQTRNILSAGPVRVLKRNQGTFGILQEPD